jgi:hypothetical protein
MYNIIFLKATKSILKAQQAKWFFFSPIWLIFCIHRFRICDPKVSTKCAGNFHAKKHVKLYIKTYVFIFCISDFLPKIFMHNYICMWKIITIQYLSLKFIPFRFHSWKIKKTKSMSFVFKAWYPNYERAHMYSSLHHWHMSSFAK